MSQEIEDAKHALIEMFLSMSYEEFLDTFYGKRDEVSEDTVLNTRLVCKLSPIEGKLLGMGDVFFEIIVVEESAESLPYVLYSVIDKENYIRISTAIDKNEKTDFDSLHLGSDAYKKWHFTV